MRDALWMSAADAAARLGVNRATLYAYVSRGFIRSQALPGSSRERGYARDDVERLRRRTEGRACSRVPRPATLAHDLRRESVALCGWRMLWLLATAASGSAATERTIDRALARVWRADGDAADLLRRTLILCADHELNVSSFTARCVASAGSSAYAVVTAGLAALAGPRDWRHWRARGTAARARGPK